MDRCFPHPRCALAPLLQLVRASGHQRSPRAGTLTAANREGQIPMMKTANETKLFPRQLAMLVLASAIAIPVCAQDQVTTGTSSGLTTQSQSTSTSAQPSPMPMSEQPLAPQH